MSKGLVARSSVVVRAPAARVFEALTKPDIIKRYMFGTVVESGWKVGDPITWKGEWQGKRYEDKGKILRLEPQRLLEYSHYSPMMGKPDVPASYHTVTIELAPAGAETRVTLAQDNNETEEAKAHSEENWTQMLTGLKALLER